MLYNGVLSDFFLISHHFILLSATPWYDLRGWLGVKQQLSICLSATPKGVWVCWSVERVVSTEAVASGVSTCVISLWLCYNGVLTSSCCDCMPLGKLSIPVVSFFCLRHRGLWVCWNVERVVLKVVASVSTCVISCGCIITVFWLLLAMTAWHSGSCQFPWFHSFVCDTEGFGFVGAWSVLCWRLWCR